jgi:alanyl-tRNA synthetase
MSDALFYESPYQSEFDARVLRREAAEDGLRVVLDRTLFYPEGGGQPADRGSLGGAEVRDVKKREGEIVHYLDTEPRSNEDGSVTGRIDWPHRYDYMQQHTGQHLLSAVMYRSFGYSTVSVHQGSEYLTIEVEAEDIPREQIEAIEDETAALIARNLPVRTAWVDAEEASALDLRREPQVSGTIRVVSVDEYDAVACGGVHTAGTGEVKLVKHIQSERIRGRLRLYWKIGDRALADYRMRTRVTAELSDLLSVPPDQLPGRLRAQQDELVELRRAADASEQRFAAAEAERLLGEAREQGGEQGGLRSVFAEYRGESKDFLRKLAEELREEEQFLLCAVNHSEKGMQWIVAAGPGVELPFNRLRSELLEPIAGKGGGKPPVWQGMGEEPEGAAEFYRRVVRAAKAGG